MGHEIGKNDGLVLAQKKAWHGLGLVVEEAPTPHEALTLAGLDWGVVQREVIVKDSEGNDVVLPGKIANFRATVEPDNFLGMVSDNYQPISNAEVADFAVAIAENSKVEVESAGSIRNGQKVWFLLRSGSYEIGNGDELFDYLLLSNGHNGYDPFRATPTNMRVVCSNTLHAVIPRQDTGELGLAALVLKHTTNVMDRVAEAKVALKQYDSIRQKQRDQIEQLSKKGGKTEDFQKFFYECYEEDFGEIPLNPTTKVEERRKARAQDAYLLFAKRFDDEKEIANASWWCALNAYSGLIQHDRKARGKDDGDRVAKRQESNLFGLNQTRTQAAWIRACQTANVC